MLKLMDLLNEGLFNKGVLKAVFMAGGPGSGKSYVAGQIFGIPKNMTFSMSGLKTVNSDTEFEHLIRKYGFDTFGTGKIDIDLWPDEVFDMIAGGDEDSEDMTLRKKAKLMTRDRQKQYMNSRLGMIMDGTGHNYSKIAKEKFKLEMLGYDTYMVFVNTSLEVAQKRNLERTRRLPEKILTKSWKDVQQNLGKFQGLFGSKFAVVDNSKFLKPGEAEKKFNMITKKYVSKFVNQPVKNKIGKNWIEHQKLLKSPRKKKKVVDPPSNTKNRTKGMGYK